MVRAHMVSGEVVRAHVYAQGTYVLRAHMVRTHMMRAHMVRWLTCRREGPKPLAALQIKSPIVNGIILAAHVHIWFQCPCHLWSELLHGCQQGSSSCICDHLWWRL